MLTSVFMLPFACRVGRPMTPFGFFAAATQHTGHVPGELATASLRVVAYVYGAAYGSPEYYAVLAEPTNAFLNDHVSRTVSRRERDPARHEVVGSGGFEPPAFGFPLQKLVIPSRVGTFLHGFLEPNVIPV